VTGEEPDLPAASPAAELLALTRALRRQLGEERRRGRVRTRRAVPPPAPTAAAASAAAPPKASPAEPRTAPTEPRTAPAGPRTSCAGPAPSPPASGEADVPTRALARGAATLEELRAVVAACTACELCETRTQTVFADGDGSRRVLFVGEAPGAEEDARGVPFVGPAGRLLTDIIVKGMRLAREEVYIANVLKCRPPGNRDPRPGEKELCTPFLDRQIELVDPRVIIPLGRHAAGHLLGTDAPLGKLRGRVHPYRGRVVVPTYHPAYLLRSPQMKSECWKDIQLAMAELGLPPPA